MFRYPRPNAGFTAVILTYDRLETLFKIITQVREGFNFKKRSPIYEIVFVRGGGGVPIAHSIFFFCETIILWFSVFSPSSFFLFFFIKKGHIWLIFFLEGGGGVFQLLIQFICYVKQLFFGFYVFFPSIFFWSLQNHFSHLRFIVTYMSYCLLYD